MESRWHFVPGQIFNQREISLHASNTAWKKITGHLDQKKIAEDSIEKEKVKKKWIKEKQEEIKKDWKGCRQVCI